jgi:type I restriction enzyme S subunit
MSNWKTVTLGDIAKIYDGTHQTPNYVPVGIPFYSVEHVTSNNFSDTKFVSKDVFDKENERVRIEKGDILMTRIGDVGTARYIDWEVNASFYVSLALIKCKKDVDSRYIAQLINSEILRREIWSKTLHVAFPNKINLGDIGKCRLVLPDLDEQLRIVAILETWDTYIDKLSKEIAAKNNIRRGFMQKVLTGKLRAPGFTGPWEDVKIKDVATVVSGATPDTTKPEYWNGEINWITPTEITKLNNGRITADTDRKITALGLKSCAASLIPAGSLILCSRATVGACAINTYPIATNQGFKSLIPKKNILVDFLYYKIIENKNSLLRFSSGSTFLEFSKKDLEKLSIKLPNLDEQRAIVDILKNANRSIEELIHKRNAIEAQKTYLVNNLVTGEIRTPKNLEIGIMEATHA